jgi:hypothetical protein
VKFDEEFEKAIVELYPKGVDWDLIGVLTRTSKVYTLSYDSKILSGIFEILCEPIIIKVAKNNGLILVKGVQNAYPEFTLFDERFPNNKIAVDIKSTYRQRLKNGDVKPFAFTLGSYRSYLRDPEGKKSIRFPYKEYTEHWVVGFLYDRNPECKFTDIKEVIEASKLEPPFSNVEFFIFIIEKYKIAGKKLGSGNTTNMASLKSAKIEDFKTGKGPFTSHEEFEIYWRGYSKDQ